MYSLIRLFSVFYFICFIQCQGLILEISSISEVLPYVQKDSLFVTGVQGVLVETTQMLGSSEWAAYEVQRRVEKEGLSKKDAIDAITPIWQRILLTTRMKAFESTTMGVIRQIQKNGNKILGVARQDVEMIYTMLGHLRALDMDLVRSAPSKEMIALSTEKYAKYIDGLLCVGTGGDSAGGVAKLVSVMQNKPRHIVFLDVDPQAVKDAVGLLEAQGIETQGIVLKSTENRNTIYLPAVGEIQLKFMDKMLPDQEARYLLNQGLGAKE